jgi:tetratricopeptide (TPR) repeat protein
MPQSPGRLSRFWRELKRRNVLRSLAIYAGTAFIILEASTIIFPRWNFPDWSIDLVLWLLVLGAFINIIIAWIYDITPGGMQKTKPLEEISSEEKTTDSRGWKAATYISLVVIVALIILNVVPSNREAMAGDIDSLVILPFDNYTGDDRLENMVSSMHSLLIGDMGRIGGLRVISPTTSNVYKNVDLSIPEIASELGVNAVLDLDVMCFGDTICFQVKVITPFPEEKLLWIADYKEEKSQMLNLYNRIAKQIAEEVKIGLSPGEEQRLAESRTVDPEAIDAYLKGQFHRERLGREDLDSAQHYFQIAIKKDPDWADPYVAMARVWGVRAGFRYTPQAEAIQKRYEYLNKALELDPNSAKVHYLKAGTAVWTEWEWEKAEKEFLIALELNPNDALSRVYYAHFLMIMRRTNEALDHANLAVELDPMRSLVQGLYGVVIHYTGDNLSALAHFEKALSIDPDNNFVPGNLAGTYLETGDTLKWHEIMKGRWRWSNDEYLAYLDSIFQEDGYLGVIEDRIRINEEVYGRGGNISFIGQARRYLAVKNYDKAMDYFEKAYEEKHGLLAYISLYFLDYPELTNNPRYIALLKKMNLPLPED